MWNNPSHVKLASDGIASVAWRSSQSGRARKRAREKSDTLPDWLERQATLASDGKGGGGALILERAPIRDRALISFLRNNRMFKAKKLI